MKLRLLFSALLLSVALAVRRGELERLQGSVQAAALRARRLAQWALEPEAENAHSTPSTQARRARLAQEVRPLDGRHSRRQTFVMAALAVGAVSSSAWRPKTSMATEEPASLATDGPQVTGKIYLDIDIGRRGARRVILGLYGRAAPKSVEQLTRLATGQIGGGLSLDSSSVWRVKRDERIDFGRLAGGKAKSSSTVISSTGVARTIVRDVPAVEKNDDDNALKHDRKGLVSCARGGGSFEFLITPSANPALDADMLVIGEVISGMDVIDDLNALPATKEDILGSKQAFVNAGKNFDPRAKNQYIGKPLTKVVVVAAGLVK